MNATLTLTYFLVGALLTNVLLKLWLNARQVRHVARHRGEVPAAFASQISLTDHQKAADYTLAKANVSQIDIGVDAAVLIAWTLMGGLSALLGGRPDRFAFVALSNFCVGTKVWFQQNDLEIVVK